MLTVELLLARILFVCGFAIIGLLAARLLRLDSGLACLGAGVAAGFSLPYLMFDTGVRAHNLQDLVFYIILPLLIFEAAWYLKPRLLRQWFLPALILAVPGAILVTLVSGALMYVGIGHASGFPWIAAFLTGAIISATDPTAVVAKLKQLDAPEGLATLMESESLFNDATAVVLFSVVLTMANGSSAASGSELAWEFLLAFVGGGLLGALCGIVTAGLVRMLGNAASSSFILVFSALASFYLAEHLLQVSGIMAVTFCAVLARQLLRHRKQEMEGTRTTMEWLGHALNAVLFTLMGLVITFDMFSERWLAMLIAIGAGLAARMAGVACSAGVSQVLGRKISLGWQLVLWWGGVRGAVAIALVLALPEDLPYWWTIQSMVFGVVLFSLLVQGTSVGLLLKRVPDEQA